MPLIHSQDQNIGSICENLVDTNYSTNGNVNCTGHFSGTYGTFTGSGIFSGYGYIASTGYFSITGRVTGNAPGWQVSGAYSNGLPQITLSGSGAFSGTDIVSQNSYSGFSARNSFINTGSTSGNTVITSYSGFGSFQGSGLFVCSPDYGSGIEVTGSIMGNGTLVGHGACLELDPSYSYPTCSICSQLFLASGRFQVDGGYTGNSVYKQYSNDYPSTIALGSYTVYNNNLTISGFGDYVATGIFTGYSSKMYYGTGIMTGSNIIYDSGAFIPNVSQGFYGLGGYTGSGYMVGTSGWYNGYGIAKGAGSFTGYGSVSGLDNTINYITGRDACAKGWGTIFLLSGTTITGVYCTSIAPDPTLQCSGFGTYLSYCSQIGSLHLDFIYNGDCLNFNPIQ